MKNTKYNYNKASHAFFDSINHQKSKFYANNMMPMPQQMPSKSRGGNGGGANMFIGGNENMYYVNGIEANNQNGCHYYDPIPQHVNANGMMLTNHNMAGGGGGRQRYAPYSYQKRSYEHSSLPPVKQSRFYNYNQTSQQQTQPLVSSNLVNISEQSSPADSSFR